MTILVTGCAGFIGWKTTELLLQAGHQVVGIDNLNDYYDKRLKRWRLEALEARDWKLEAGGSFQFHQIDIENKEELNKIFSPPTPSSQLPAPNSHAEGVLPTPSSQLPAPNSHAEGVPPTPSSQLPAPNSHAEGVLPAPSSQLPASSRFSAIINLAARAGVRASIENPWIYQSTNVTGTLNLLECCREHKVPKFILASTSSLYAGQPAPFREDQPVDHPISPYAASKKSAEVLAYTYHHLYGIDVSVVRYFTVFGPAGRPDMSPLKFTDCIARGEPIPLYGDGTQSRDFTYIDDIASGTIAALKPLGYEIINLGGGMEPMSINDMIRYLEDRLGKKAKINYLPQNNADMTTTRADISKANTLLNWHPKTTPQQGFNNLVDWYEQTKSLNFQI